MAVICVSVAATVICVSVRGSNLCECLVNVVDGDGQGGGKAGLLAWA